jgi:ATP-binding protein involved in chromosome partitioning
MSNSVISDDVLARQKAVIELLKQVIEPILKNDVVSLGMVRNLRVVDDYVYLRLYVGDHQKHLQTAIETALLPLDWCKKTYVQLCTIPGVKITLAISSGKGGVGKSTISVNLAAALTLQGAKVGLLDADVYGPNVPQMLGLGQALLAEPDHPLAWRGPVLHKIVTQFLHDVDWGELDFLLIDLPPGTGDAQITIIQESPICGVLLVTTPQQVAIADVRRSVHMFRGVGVPVLGIIENMSYLIDSSGTHTAIFGAGGGMQLANELQVPLLGSIPIDPKICEGGDTGNPIAIAQPNSTVGQVFGQIAAGVITKFQNKSISSDYF